MAPGRSDYYNCATSLLRSMTTLLQFMSLAFPGLFGLPVMLFGPNIFTLSPITLCSQFRQPRHPKSIICVWSLHAMLCSTFLRRSCHSSHVNGTPNRVAPLLDTTIFCPGTGYSVLIFLVLLYYTVSIGALVTGYIVRSLMRFRTFFLLPRTPLHILAAKR